MTIAFKQARNRFPVDDTWLCESEYVVCDVKIHKMNVVSYTMHYHNTRPASQCHAFHLPDICAKHYMQSSLQVHVTKNLLIYYC